MVGENVPLFPYPAPGERAVQLGVSQPRFTTFSTVPTNDTKLSRAETALKLGRSNIERKKKKRKIPGENVREPVCRTH